MNIKHTWKAVGGKPIKFEVIKIGVRRYVKCANGYVQLCDVKRCKKLALLSCNKCLAHNKDVCIVENCNRVAAFNSKCSNHRPQYCKFEGCQKYPGYGIEGHQGQYCRIHKKEGMINLKARLCQYPNCFVSASYNYPGESRKFCKNHKEPDMICVAGKLCEHPNCYKFPCFGFPQIPFKRQFCFQHKKEGMINLHNKLCECGINASYGYLTPEKCFKHKEEGMINLTCKRCEFPDCQTVPSFGYSKATYCKEHKLDDMHYVH